MFESEQQFRRTLHLQLYTTRTKHLISRSDIKFHIGDIKLTLIIVLHLTYFLLPILSHYLTFAVRTILIHRHHIGGSYLRFTNARAHHVATTCSVILHRSCHIIGCLQIQTTLRTGQILIIVCTYTLHLQWRHHHTVIILPRHNSVLRLCYS